MLNDVWSKYNYYHEIEDNKTIIFNTFTKKGIVIKNEDLKNPDLNQQEIMRKKGIIVGKGINEKKIVDMEFLKWTYADDILHLTIIPTDACNFRCIYCYEMHEEHYMDDMVADSIINYIKRNIYRFKTVSIGWFGGEPLLAVDKVIYLMKEIKEICIRNKVLLVSNMTTNGYLLSPIVFGKLLDVGIRFFQITLDGLEQIHDKQRPLFDGSGSYGKIVENLIEGERAFRAKRFEVGIRINISPQLDRIRDEILTNFSEKFGGKSHFTFIFEWIRDWGGDIRNDVVTTALICKNWIMRATELGLKCADMLTNNCGLEFCEACKYNGFLVDYDGTLKKCSIAAYDEHYNDINLVGRLDKYGRKIINRNNLASWMIQDRINEKCKRCCVYPICMGINCPFSTNIKETKNCLPILKLIPVYLENLYMSNHFEHI